MLIAEDKKEKKENKKDMFIFTKMYISKIIIRLGYSQLFQRKKN